MATDKSSGEEGGPTAKAQTSEAVQAANQLLPRNEDGTVIL
ncbi:hypothetical protein ABZ917_35595 [Nonomuraea wenchangensis]